tara:strand:+ start:39 stop:245 length:207 start_codon:yes stop_codon:yes gene_type:complete
MAKKRFVKKKSRNVGPLMEDAMIIPSGLLSGSARTPMAILKFIGDMERMKFPKKQISQEQKKRLIRKQ